MSINDCPVQDLSTATFPWKAYLESVCSFGSNAKKTILQTSHFVKELCGSEQTFKKAGADASSGYMLRQPYVCAKDKKCSFISDTFVDLFKVGIFEFF